ncbi:hypothetical protein B0H67DRAFT_580587 [Lasiosphaeris hirsuta]|uniref:Biogenesis of lysosome-related organelles complex 1 subunit CNL1 n=1 Tax=Lasiosphaeris hirsuta TaxID=260670 RepID=A0AA40AGH9_9PEZI|nr:hypothetical protein B0H67DRAFT_580587 [Lasiosphaeris hirsuta]
MDPGGGHLLMLNSVSLTALGRHFDRQIQHIQQRLEYLTEQSTVIMMHVYDRAGNLTENSDLEIARYHDIMKQIDEVELDLHRIAHIRDLVRDFRRRGEELSSRRGDRAHAGGRGSSRSRGGRWASHRSQDRPTLPAGSRARLPTTVPTASYLTMTDHAPKRFYRGGKCIEPQA